MTRLYNERRNRQVIVMIDKRKIPPKDVPPLMLRLGFVITYENVRQIIRRFRKCHKVSQNVTTLPKK